MKKIISVILFFIFTVSAFGQGTRWFEGSLDEAREQAKENGKLVVVYFYSPM